MHLAPGTPSITAACGLLAGAQSRGHVAARQPGKRSLVLPSRGGKGCGERLAGLLAGRRCVCGFSMGNSAEHRVENEYILLNE